MLLVTYRQSIDLTAVSVILPILAITYLTFRTSLGRLADANRHVTQVNDLYLSTIETLAMAVDAKDQITHGHIRRVQVYAVELAKRLGVTSLLSSRPSRRRLLLHDMGKLAIPEHILNKPGKLTPAEFETMKRHADIGADLLSSIRFPYPVVPIVRHHHEQWNGQGYPSGISGTDIPLGARILAVVDCFDALNSDRPYRPRLSVSEAFAILRDRRGTMYDPLVVDHFISAYHEMVVAANEAGEQARTLLVTHAARDSGSGSARSKKSEQLPLMAPYLAATRQNILDARNLTEVMRGSRPGSQTAHSLERVRILQILVGHRRPAMRVRQQRKIQCPSWASRTPWRARNWLGCGKSTNDQQLRRNLGSRASVTGCRPSPAERSQHARHGSAR